MDYTINFTITTSFNSPIKLMFPDACSLTCAINTRSINFRI